MKGSLTERSYFMLQKKGLVMHLKGRLFPWVVFFSNFDTILSVLS